MLFLFYFLANVKCDELHLETWRYIAPKRCLKNALVRDQSSFTMRKSHHSELSFQMSLTCVEVVSRNQELIYFYT